MTTPEREAHTVLTPVQLPVGGQFLYGDLGVPAQAHGVVVFAHGSGSSRHSPRNKLVAQHLRERGLSTLLFDLLTHEEDAADERTHEFRFDVVRLGQRLAAITDWLMDQSAFAALPIGLFGASTGAAAALVAAAERPACVSAVVSRGGRPDLAGAALAHVQAPTLLIVGGEDQAVVELNRKALSQMPGPVHLEIVPGATHLFEEPGALERVAELAASWFVAVFKVPGNAGSR